MTAEGLKRTALRRASLETSLGRQDPDHVAARATLSRLLGNGDRLALAPQVLAEFIHVVTDSRRFRQPVEIII
jgi:predicted nucleic acid-binding protein